MAAPDVRRSAARIGFLLLVAAAATLLVGIWTWDARWTLTAVVVVVLSLICAIAAATPREPR